MADLGDMIAKLMLDASSWIDGLKKAEAETQTETEKMEGSFGKVGETLASVAETVAAWKITEKLVEFGNEAIDLATEVGKLQASFDILAGSAEASAEIFERMQGLELKSKFDFAEVLGPAAQRMLELGINAKQTGETMTALVDAASALKKGPEWVNAVTETIAGMQARLVASARDMRSFESEGIDAWGALAEKIGTSVPEAIEMVKKGMVTAQTVTEAVTGEMQKQFSGAAELTGNSWNGAMAILKNSADNAKEAIGQGLLKVLNDFSPVLNTLSGLIQDFAKWWEGLSTPVQTVIIAFTAALPIIAAISAALPLLEAGLAAVAAAFMGPVIPIAALVAALALIGKWVYDEWPAIKNVFIVLWDDIVTAWKAVWDGMSKWLDTNFGGIATLIGKTWTDLKTIVGDTIDWIVEKFNAFVGMVGGWIEGVGKFAMAIPGVGKTVGDLTEAWNKGQAAIAKNKAEVEAHSEAIKKNAQETQANINDRRQQEAADLAAANATKAAAKEADDYAKMLAQIAKESKPIKQDNTELALSLGDIALAHQHLKEEMDKARKGAVDLKENGFDKIGMVIPDIKEGFERLDTTLTNFTGKMANVKTTAGDVKDALLKMGTQTQEGARLAYEHSQKLADQAKAAGDVVSSFDQLALEAKATQDHIDLLKKSTGDNSAELKTLQTHLDDTKRKMDDMDQSVAATEKAFSDLGVTAPSAVSKMQTDITRDLDTIARVAGTDSEAYKLAWGNAQQAIYDKMVTSGTSLSSAQKEDLGKIEAHRDEWFESNKSAWGTAYGEIKTLVGGTFDDLTKQIVTGDLSFGKLFTNLWQGIAEAALNAFINPLKTAITNFISHELADLLGDKGLGGVLSGLKNIGTSIAGVFGGAGNAAYQTTSAAGGLSTTIASGGEAAAGAAQTGTSAAGTAASTAASSITGIVGAVGGVVSAVSGVISNFQMAKQETTLNAIEHNTRYTMMYVGERADGGILGVLFKIDEELAWGNLTKATENMRDILKDRMNDLLGATNSIQDAVVNGIAPYMGNIKGTLEDIRTETVNTANAVREVNVSVQATGVTTQEAAKMLGDQIAANLTRQMVPVTA